jgi:mannonate dehydratase
MALGLVGVGLFEHANAAAAAAPRRDTGYRVLPDLPVRRNDGIRLGGDYQNVAGSTITDPRSLAYWARFNARHITAMAPTAATKEELWRFPQSGGFLNADGPWDGDRLKRMQEDCRKAGLTLEGIRMDSAYIIMKEGPQRDRYLDIIRENIRKAAAAGITLISYHWTMITIRRNLEVKGRGGATYGGFKLERNYRDLPPTEVAGRVSSEDYWSRIDYFLKNIVPTAREMKVKLACHPYDPGGLPLGYQGVDNWDAGDYIAALKKYELLYDDIYNGFTYDTGVAGESLDDPNAQLDILRYLAERGKIAQMHFRNIRGHRNDFVEPYHDEGDINLLNCMRVLRDTGWSGTLLPDHVPSHPDDPGGLQGFAHAYGYMEGLLRATRDEAAWVTGTRTR